MKNRYPLSLIGESLDWLGRAKQFTKLDLTSAYHQMEIREGDECKTAFHTRNGLSEYQVMAFDLFNTLANIQSYINNILVAKLDIFIILHLDNILIYTGDPCQRYIDVVC